MHPISYMAQSTTSPGNHKRESVELWAGMECTHNRVADSFFDQLDRTGHSCRLGDLRLIARLGATAVRYPVLWERIAPMGLEQADWRWPDERLKGIRELGITPIVGLLHHGSGPGYTNLLDPEFPLKLSTYARAVAERFPWIRDYTPVNEPLTTARFSGLYGHWYPHGKDERTFMRVLLHELRGTAMAMRAIREVNPAARLIQTEDLGHTSSTPLLSYQADFENVRRWLTFDLLCGKVSNAHPLWDYITEFVPLQEVQWFAEHPCPPDVIGFNYYLTSERFLHEKLYLYPRSLHGGNGRNNYADLETARIRTKGLMGLKTLLVEAWQRFGLPLAITECHNGCTREEQMRWVKEVWDACLQAKAEGAEIRAVTAWSLFGSFDWNTLVTQDNGHYEPGVFDVRSNPPRPTALAGLFTALGNGESPDYPLLHVPGWWNRPERLIHGFSVLDSGKILPVSGPHPLMRRQALRRVRPVLITGAKGTLGRALAHACDVRAIPFCLLSRKEMDIAESGSVESCLTQLEPWAVVNAAGYVRVDEAEAEQDRCYRENTLGPATLAATCALRGIRFITFSSDLVFDGSQREPYGEYDSVSPINHYGRSKAIAEQAVLSVLSTALVIRTSAFFGLQDDFNFLTVALRQLASGKDFRAAYDCTISPTFVPDLVNHTLDLLMDGEAGIWHLANEGAVTWLNLARRAAQQANVSTRRLIGLTAKELDWPASRPQYSALGSERGQIMPTLDSAIRRYIAAGSWLNGLQVAS